MTKKAEIYYFSLTDEMPREEKLAWFKKTRFAKIPFDKINPDEKGNWLNLTDNDFDSLIPLVDKENEAIFRFSSLGVSTNRDEWVYDFSKESLKQKMQFFIKTYNDLLKNHDDNWNESIKWSESLKSIFKRKEKIKFTKDLLIESNYRPFIKQFYYAENFLSDRLTQNHYDIFGEKLDNENISISVMLGTAKPFSILIIQNISDLNFLSSAAGGTTFFSFYIYDKEGNSHDNITDWALNEFKNNYEDSEYKPRFVLQKIDIFHYVYAVLHNPDYREKYEQNLKREFPRIPFYENFAQWAEWGKQLMDLHLNYETIEKYPLERQDLTGFKDLEGLKAKLKADKESGVIFVDDNTTISGIPLQAWQYKLGNRSALEWILDQYKEKKPKDPTIAEKFNNYRFADYKEQVIDLLMRVCTVSVETVKIIQAMKNSQKFTAE